MAQNTESYLKNSRRKFLRDASLLVGSAAIGSAGLLTSCSNEPDVVTKTVEVEKPITVKKSRYVIDTKPELCAGCGRCMLACSSVHEGVFSTHLANIKISENYFTGDITQTVCRHCEAPSCYFACPLKDRAMCIDSETGVRYVNQDECIGCGTCVAACPFEVPRVTVDMSVPIVNRKAHKCDLCKDRPEGPACVEFCPMGALIIKEVA